MPPRIGLPAMRLPIVTMRLPSAILESPCLEVGLLIVLVPSESAT